MSCHAGCSCKQRENPTSDKNRNGITFEKWMWSAGYGLTKFVESKSEWTRLYAAWLRGDPPDVARENPWGQPDESAPKGGAAVVTALVIMGGFGLLLWGVKASAGKKAAPVPAPVMPPIIPTAAPGSGGPEFYVYQRHIENLDTQGMKCGETTIVFGGSQRAALDEAWRRTTRAPMGGAGIVAVVVPASAPRPTIDACGWRRVCLADGSCMGVVGLSA